MCLNYVCMALDVLHLAGRRQRGSRVFVWMDSQVALGVVRKGRSSSAALNAVARRLAVAGFITDCLLMGASSFVLVLLRLVTLCSGTLLFTPVWSSLYLPIKKVVCKIW